MASRSRKKKQEQYIKAAVLISFLTILGYGLLGNTYSFSIAQRGEIDLRTDWSSHIEVSSPPVACKYIASRSRESPYLSSVVGSGILRDFREFYERSSVKVVHSRTHTTVAELKPFTCGSQYCDSDGSSLLFISYPGFDYRTTPVGDVEFDECVVVWDLYPRQDAQGNALPPPAEAQPAPAPAPSPQPAPTPSPSPQPQPGTSTSPPPATGASPPSSGSSGQPAQSAPFTSSDDLPLIPMAAIGLLVLAIVGYVKLTSKKKRR